MKNQIRAYFDEAQWFHQKHTPKMDEYTQTSTLVEMSLIGLLPQPKSIADTIKSLGAKSHKLVNSVTDTYILTYIYIYIYIYIEEGLICSFQFQLH